MYRRRIAQDAYHRLDLQHKRDPRLERWYRNYKLQVKDHFAQNIDLNERVVIIIKSVPDSSFDRLIAVIPIKPHNLNKALELLKDATGFAVHEPLTKKCLRFSNGNRLNVSGVSFETDIAMNARNLVSAFNNKFKLKPDVVRPILRQIACVRWPELRG